METKSKITERKVESEKFIRGVRMRKIIVEKTIPRLDLKSMNDIPEDLVLFCKGFFPRKNWTGWYFKEAIVDLEAYNRFLKPSSLKIYVQGVCDKKQKVILMDPFFSGKECPDVFRVGILLHEMAHAVTTERHTKIFFDHLERCKRFAQKLGYGPLADQISKEIKQSKKTWLFKDGTMRKIPKAPNFERRSVCQR